MNPLINAKPCELYHLDFSFAMKARFDQPTPGTITLIFSERPQEEVPFYFYLIPEYGKNSFVSYLCAKAGALMEYRVETTGATYYIMDSTTNDTPAARRDLRIGISLNLEATFNGSAPSPITLKDISAGGTLFLSSKRLACDTIASFSLDTGRARVPLKARIVSTRPTPAPDVFAYGCQFLGLTEDDESAIRNFVFTEELRQRRLARETSGN